MSENERNSTHAISWAVISLLSKSDITEIGLYETNNDWHLFKTDKEFYLVKVGDFDKNQYANFSFSVGEENKYPTEEIRNIFDSFIKDPPVKSPQETTIEDSHPEKITIVLVINNKDKKIIISFNAEAFKGSLSNSPKVHGRITYNEKNGVSISPKSIIEVSQRSKFDKKENIDFKIKEDIDFNTEAKAWDYAISRYKQLLERDFKKFICYDDMKNKTDGFDAVRECINKKEKLKDVFRLCKVDNPSKRYDCLKKNNTQLFKEIKDEFAKLFKNNLSIEDVAQKLDENCKCEYCGMTKKELESRLPKDEKDIGQETSFFKTKRFLSGRGWSMELDRKTDTNYTISNIVCSCYWCNNAKSDEFSYEEWLEVGEKIKEIWAKRDEKFKQK